jgi:hypothetical protein
MRAQHVQIMVRFTGHTFQSAAKGALRAAWKLAALKQSRPLFLRCTQAALKMYGHVVPRTMTERIVKVHRELLIRAPHCLWPH